MENKKTERASLAEQILDLVLLRLADNLKRTPCEACGSRGVSAMDMANALKFLKDNGFEVERGSERDALDDIIARRKALPDPESILPN